MTQDKHSGLDPGGDFPMSPEDEAFLRMVEDSYEAAGQPKDEARAEKVWGKLEARLAGGQEHELKSKAAKAEVRSISSSRKRRNWPIFGSLIGLAAAMLLFLNIKPNQQDVTQVRGGEAGFSASLKIYEKAPDGSLSTLQVGASGSHQVVVKVEANGDGQVTLFRQVGEAKPEFVTNFSYKSGQGEMTLLDEQGSPGTKYCVLGAKDEEGLKHLVELVQDLWAYLPASSCQVIP